ncbi:MAG: hypothetical protein IPM46_09975 [Flavobacteriales bacterium]|nr:hypothetical protein [Flavobacteriales bacterium]
MQRILAILTTLCMVVTLHSCEEAPQQEQAVGVAHGVESEHNDGHFEVAVYMGRIQRYHQKWWLAGKMGNAELAGFYLHEMEEALEAIADADVEEDGVKLRPLVESYGLASIERLEAKLKAEGVAAMHADAGQLVLNCNACHVASGHSFIRIQEPDEVSFPDQDFAPAD